MLKKVKIKKFRTCVDLDLRLSPDVTLLLGRNASGKTNILQAIAWAAERATNPQGSHWDPMTSSSSPAAEVSFEFELNGRNCRYELKFVSGELTFEVSGDPPLPRPAVAAEPSLTERLSEKDNGAHRQLLTRCGRDVEVAQRKLRIEPSTPSLPALLSLLDQPLEIYRDVHRFLSGVRYYPLDESSEVSGLEYEGFIREENYRKWLIRDRKDPCGSVPMKILHMKLEEPDRFDELRSLVEAHGLGVVDRIEVKTLEPSPPDSRLYVQYFWPTGAGQSCSYGELSHGTRRLLRIIVAVLFDRSTVFLMEQPEDSIHPWLLQKVIDLLRSYSEPSQFILTSHSPLVIDCLPPDSVRVVTLENGKTRVRPLQEAELENAKRFLSEEGSLSDFLEIIQQI